MIFFNQGILLLGSNHFRTYKNLLQYLTLHIPFSVSSTSPLAVDAVTQLRCVLFLGKFPFHIELRKDKAVT